MAGASAKPTALEKRSHGKLVRRRATDWRMFRQRQWQGEVQDLGVQEAHDASGHDWGRSGRCVKLVMFTVLLYQMSHEVGSSVGAHGAVICGSVFERFSLRSGWKRGPGSRTSTNVEDDLSTNESFQRHTSKKKCSILPTSLSMSPRFLL